ncbi:MAG: molybdopterin-synthase adenylyltransferase MoeB [bacterium]|nr:molybdopterin-synthase adenylyltransferase MoeB [bacterium]
MSVSISVPTVLRRFTGDQATVTLEAATVAEALHNLTAAHPALQKHLYDGDGKLRSFVNVYVGQQDVRHLPDKYHTALHDGAQLTIVPSIAGGSDLPPQSSGGTKGGKTETGNGTSRATLTTQEYRQYSRHLLLPEVGVAGQLKLKQASVLVVGAGGLGSPLLAYLAAAGVGRMGIVDADVVDETNLQRQIIHGRRSVGLSKLSSAREFIKNLNPHVHVETYETFFTAENALGIAAGYDLLIDGTDNFPTRYLVNDVSFLLKKRNVYGSIYRFEGQISVFCDPDGPCYRCLYPEPPPPGLVPSCAEGGVLGVLPGIVGSIQANEALKILLGIGTPLVGTLLRFDALDLSFKRFDLHKDPDCPLCGAHPTITEPVDYVQFCGLGTEEQALTQVREMTVHELFARRQNGNGSRPIVLDVRNAEELAIARLNEDLHIPLAELDFRLDELAPYKERDLVISCRSGVRSARAWHQLRAAGFEKIYNLEGGILAWADHIDNSLPKY